MNEYLWSILAEFTHKHSSDHVEQTSEALKTAIRQLSPPEAFAQRLCIAFSETIDKHLQRIDEEQAVSTVRMRILSNSAGQNAQESSSTWGFFFIETDQIIELYLYQDRA